MYDLKPQTESYYEAGVAHTFGDGIDGYVNVWQRNVWNVLDTTQIFPTPIFAVFNNALGLAHGFELRLEGRNPAASWYLSGTFSQSVAGGISGGTFLFPPRRHLRYVAATRRSRSNRRDQRRLLVALRPRRRVLRNARFRLRNRLSGAVRKRHRPVAAAPDVQCVDRTHGDAASAGLRL